MKKILPVNKPPLTAYMNHAPILSILSDNEKYLPWFFLNYIQMRVRDDGMDFYHFYTSHYSCPFFNTTYLSRQFLPKYIKHKNICDFFTHCIDDNYYIIAIIDTSFIELYSSSNRDAHPIFIYGYDKNNETFSVADFFNNGIFSFKNTSFLELEFAYKNCDDRSYWMNGIHLLQRIEYIPKYTVSSIIDSLKKYLYGHETSIGYNQNIDENSVFGLNVSYDRLLKEIQNYESLRPYDNRLLPVFCAHKIVLKMLNEFLIKNDFSELVPLQLEYDYLYKQFIILRNNILKSRLKNKIYDEDNESQIYKLKNIEINLIQDTINILENEVKKAKTDRLLY